MGTASIIKTVIKFISGESEEVCRLCFVATKSRAIALEDHANIVSPSFEGVVNYGDMLLQLGVSTEPSMPFLLCPKCADHIVSAFLFHKLCQYSNAKWLEVLNKINTVLDQSETIQDNVKTAHFLMRDNENVMFVSRKGPLKTKQEALVKFKAILVHQKSKKKTKSKPPLQIICEECGDDFNSKVRLTKHMLSHSDKKYTCRECPKVFRTVWSLKDHTERHHTPKKIQCPICAKMVSTERLLRMHHEREHKATVCKLCFIQFPSKRALEQHLNKHDQYKCPLCQKMFTNKQSSQVHIKGCGKEQVIQKVFCDICNMGYRRKNALRTHLKIKHGFSKEVFQCNWCDKKFDAASRLRNHIVKHTKEKNFHCEKCGGMFVTQAALTYHIRLHTGEKPYKCDMCSETFLSASRRMEHKRRKHLGPQKQCPLCNSKFITENCLKIHIARHKNPQSKLYIEETDKSNSKKLAQNVLLSYCDVR